MPWDGTELMGCDLGADGFPENVERVAGGPGRIHLPAGVVPERHAPLRLGPDGLVEPVPPARGKRRAALREGGGVRPPQWMFGMSTYAFVSPGRIVCSYTERGGSHLALLDTESGELEPIETPYSSIAYVRADVAPGGVVFRGSSPTEARVHREVGPFYRGARGPATLGRLGDRSRLPLRPRARRVPHGERPDGVRVLLPAEEPGLRGAGGRASAAPRDEPRGSHVCDVDTALDPGDPVLDQPRHRRARRELRWEHGLREGVPAPPRRRVGRRRRRGLRQRGDLPGRARARGRRAAHDHRRQRGRLHDALRARFHGHVRRGREPLRGQRRGGTGEGDPQVRVALPGPPDRALPGARRPLQGTLADPLRTRSSPAR